VFRHIFRRFNKKISVLGELIMITLEEEPEDLELDYDPDFDENINPENLDWNEES
jgi:hypothetical protein